MGQVMVVFFITPFLQTCISRLLGGSISSDATTGRDE